MPCLYGGGDCIEGGDRYSSWTCSHDHLLITATDILGNEISICCRYGMITEVVSAFVKDRRGGGFGNVVSKKKGCLNEAALFLWQRLTVLLSHHYPVPRIFFHWRYRGLESDQD
jgi:hypothetical protein